MYLRWGMFIFASWVQFLMITGWKFFSFVTQRVILKSKGYPLDSMISQCKKFWSSELQINLIFTSMRAHLCFLSATLDENRVKIFFIWDSEGTLRIQWGLIGKSMKKFWSLETQINLIFTLRHVHLYFLS